MNEPAHNTTFIEDALNWLPTASFDDALDFYEDFTKDPACTDPTVAAIGRGDRFFLLTHLLRRPDAIHPWLYERCREVEAKPDECLDLWARFHYKSTIITFAGCIQEIFINPDITIAIFSHTKGIAKGFLEHIKMEFEQNSLIKRLYPDVLYEEPARESSRWSLDRGIVVKRKANPKEGTVEAWGLVDGQPTSRHFNLRVYDDTVSEESVNTPDQIQKTTDRWELSQNLGDGHLDRRWHIGTRYSFADTYQTMLERNVLTARVYPATDTGTVDGNPVFMTPEKWEKKVKDESSRTIACQMLQNPAAGEEQEFKPEYLRPYEVRPLTLNVAILCDYAGSRKTTGSSNTAMAVVGVDSQNNKYILDGACHKMDLDERWKMLKMLRNKWVQAKGVQIVKVGYERFGAQSDIEHFEAMMRIEQNAFPIEELAWPRDGDFPKDNRIRRLVPDLKNWRFFIPYQGDPTKLQTQAKSSGQDYLIAQPIKRKNHEGRVYNLIEWWIKNEYLFFPNTTKKDFLDALSRIYDIDLPPPEIIRDEDIYPEPEDY